MPCVCKKICGKNKKDHSIQPYRQGKRYCAVCKIFQIPNNKNRCFCCNGLLRLQTKSLAPERRKMRIWQWTD